VFQTELKLIGVLKVSKASSRVEHWSFKSFKFVRSLKSKTKIVWMLQR
jgi:hypothetical protein